MRWYYLLDFATEKLPDGKHSTRVFANPIE